MSPDRWTEISDLFNRAAALDPSDRTALLDRNASSDPALREEVERLLALDADAAGFLESSASAPRPPASAGPWRLVERVGVGGMGEVWRAERADGAFEQTAAVKLVRPGLGDAVLARFRAERQILAGLEHPAIARLLDGGTASDGRPYLATEFVDGEPITIYCDRRRLTVNDRVALMAEVCDAVAYAHTRLVVHRDLKPSNVLVTEASQVKLLDFGIAKLLDSDDTLTQTGRPLLTPAYVAPEQLAGGAVTTATDAYGLGVLLYEILTGRRPVSDAVTRPSDAVTTAAPTVGRVPLAPDTSGTLRRTTSDRLRRRLRGDIDRICLKALRPDPERRYPNAAELGDDLRRHLDGFPIEARPESAMYRLGRFVRRHRAAAAAAAFVALWVLGALAWNAAQRVVPTAPYADRVVSVDARGQYIRPSNRAPTAALGVPDAGGGRLDAAVSLGSRGTLTLAFSDNVLTDGPGPDLAIYEATTSGERVAVEVSEDGEAWIDLGQTGGTRVRFDLAGKGRPGARYRYVRLTDVWTQRSGSGLAPGADIDAVGALNGAFAGWKRPLGWLGIHPEVDRLPNHANDPYRAVDHAVARLSMAEQSDRRGDWALVERAAQVALAYADTMRADGHDPSHTEAVQVEAGCFLGWSRFRQGNRTAAPLIRQCADRAPAIFDPASDEAVLARLYRQWLDGKPIWAERLVAHRPGSIPPSERGETWDPALVLGPPDHVSYGSRAAFPLAPSGSLVLAFDALVDGPGPDLVVLTTGVQTDRMNVAVSQDGTRWVNLEPDWGLGVFDLNGLAARYVRVSYAPLEPERDRLGVDIDAVAALHSVAPRP